MTAVKIYANSGIGQHSLTIIDTHSDGLHLGAIKIQPSGIRHEFAEFVLRGVGSNTRRTMAATECLINLVPHCSPGYKVCENTERLSYKGPNSYIDIR